MTVRETVVFIWQIIAFIMLVWFIILCSYVVIKLVNSPLCI